MMLASNLTWPDVVALIAFFAMCAFCVWCLISLTKDGGKE